MAFRKAIAAETLKLLEGLLREILLVAIRHHAGDQLLAEARDSAGVFKGCHRAAKLVSLAGREAGTLYCDAHGLLLEQGHAQCLTEYPLQFRLGIDDVLLSLAAP